MNKIFDSGFYRIHLILFVLVVIGLIYIEIYDLEDNDPVRLYLEVIGMFIVFFIIITWAFAAIFLVVPIVAGKSLSEKYLHDSRGLFRRKMDNFFGLLIILSGIFIFSYYSILFAQITLKNYNETMCKITKEVKYTCYSDERRLPGNILKWLMK